MIAPFNLNKPYKLGQHRQAMSLPRVALLILFMKTCKIFFINEAYRLILIPI